MTAETCVVPRSEAANAYDLLNDVIAAVREEPRRLNMEEWGYRGNPWEDMDDVLPPCRTVGCVAGWLTFLGDGVEKGLTSHISSRAKQLLGVVREDPFYSAVTELFYVFPREAVISTPEYVAQVVDAIRTFQAEWEARLKATPIAPQAVRNG